MPPKRGRAETAAGEEAAAAATPQVAAKRGRPKKAASSELPAEDSQASAATDATPPKAAKQPRGKAAAKAKAGAAANADGEQDAKKLRRTLTPKRDKNEPLPRTPTPRQPAGLADGKALKLLSLNVAGLRSVLNGTKAEVLKALIERERPDIFCLNEHKLKVEDVADNEAKLRSLLPKEYGTYHWSCSTAKKGYAGVAVILRTAPEGEPAAVREPASVKVTEGMGALGEGDPIASEEGRLLTIDLPELSIVAVYVPNSGADLARLSYRTGWDQKLCWDRNFGKYLRQLREDGQKPVVVIGDLNCCSKVQDIWNMHDRPDFPEGLAEKPVAEQYLGLTQLKKLPGLTPEERESFPKMLAEADLVDTFRTLHPNASGVFSYFSMRFAQLRPLNKGLRLDYVLASPSMCGHLKPSGEGGAPQATDAAELPVPRVADSFVLDGDELVADHAAVGCSLVLR